MKRSTKLSTRMTWDPESCVSNSEHRKEMFQMAAQQLIGPSAEGLVLNAAREWRVPPGKGSSDKRGHLEKQKQDKLLKDIMIWGKKFKT